MVYIDYRLFLASHVAKCFNLSIRNCNLHSFVYNIVQKGKTKYVTFRIEQGRKAVSWLPRKLFLPLTRPNEFGSMTVRKDDILPLKTIKCDRKP